jgi:K+ transporter
MNRGVIIYAAWAILVTFAIVLVMACAVAILFFGQCIITFRDGGWMPIAYVGGIIVWLKVVQWAYKRVCQDEQIATGKP